MLKNKLLQYFSENIRLRYAVRVLKNLNNMEFCNDVIHIYDSLDKVYIEHKGNENNGKIIYYIRVDDKLRGFFALMRVVVNNLWFADRNGLTPVVELSNDILYAEKKICNGTKNPFEYYFEPINIANWENSTAIVKNSSGSNPVYGNVISNINNAVENYFTNKYKVSDEYFNEMSRIWRKYIRLNQTLIEEIYDNDIYRIIKNNRTLAVHVRGTDFKEHWKDHPLEVPEQEELELVKKQKNAYRYEKIFLATDEEKIVRLYQKEFKEDLLYFPDTLRSTDGKAVHSSQNERENHHYRLGVEILKDAYMMSECEGLIAGVSQVSNFVQIIKLSRNEPFLSCHIIDKGCIHS